MTFGGVFTLRLLWKNFLQCSVVYDRSNIEFLFNLLIAGLRGNDACSQKNFRVAEVKATVTSFNLSNAVYAW